MNHRLLPALLFLALLYGCNGTVPNQVALSAAPAPAQTAAPAVPKDAIRGDFDGDGRQEYVWLVPPRLKDNDMDCVGECVAFLACSNPAIRRYAIRQAIGGTLTKFRGLDDSGRDYLGVLPDWFTSCWRGYYVLGCPGRTWQPALPSFDTHCNQWEDGVAPVRRDPARPGYVLVRYSSMESEEIVTKTKSVALNQTRK